MLFVQAGNLMDSEPKPRCATSVYHEISKKRGRRGESSAKMLKNEVRSHHLIENKESRFGTNPRTKPTFGQFRACFRRFWVESGTRLTGLHDSHTAGIFSRTVLSSNRALKGPCHEEAVKRFPGEAKMPHAQAQSRKVREANKQLLLGGSLAPRRLCERLLIFSRLRSGKLGTH
jgi:hypothetical protein